ncbi:MAG TPA: hypothetical protein VKH81_10320 [Candidatus Angelobacter sp.]|nr:hypothetical protein [Candidatus Angelobacter sp.]
MGWIQEHLRQSAQNSTSEPAEDRFASAARERWRKLGDELRADVAEFSAHRSGAAFSAEGENRFHVDNSGSGLELAVIADFENHTVRYRFAALNNRAGIPEGGMLSMRQTPTGSVEFYSADECLTSEETRRVLLEPMLFPRPKPA